MRLGVRLGNSVSMISPASRVTPVGLIPKMKLFTVVGFFQSGMFEYDANLAFISIPAAQKFFSMQDRVTGVEIWVDDIDQAGRIAAEIQERLGFPYHTRDWMSMNRNLFNALQMDTVLRMTPISSASASGRSARTMRLPTRK